MFNYKAYGLNISSEIRLPGMIEANSDAKFDVYVRIGKVNIPVPRFIVVDNGDIYIYLKNIGTAKISSVDQIIVDPISNLEKGDETNIIHLILGPVMAILLHKRGFLMLHGSSVKYKNEAVAFIGNRGLGKSTIAMNFYKNGYSIINDDILAIDFDDEGLPIIYPGYPHVRLLEDSFVYLKDNINILTPIPSMVGKIFCDASRGFSPGSVKLKRIYILEKGKKTRISVFKSQENLINLIRHSLVIKVLDSKTDHSKNLIQCAKLINNIDIRCLEISHSFKNLHNMVEIIEEDLSR